MIFKILRVLIFRMDQLGKQMTGLLSQKEWLDDVLDGVADVTLKKHIRLARENVENAIGFYRKMERRNNDLRKIQQKPMTKAKVKRKVGYWLLRPLILRPDAPAHELGLDDILDLPMDEEKTATAPEMQPLIEKDDDETMEVDETVVQNDFVAQTATPKNAREAPQCASTAVKNTVSPFHHAKSEEESLEFTPIKLDSGLHLPALSAGKTAATEETDEETEEDLNKSTVPKLREKLSDRGKSKFASASV